MSGACGGGDERQVTLNALSKTFWPGPLLGQALIAPNTVNRA